MNYKTSNKGMAEIIGHEGLSQSKYLDSVGVETIGAGSTITELPSIASIDWSYVMPLTEVMALFEKSLPYYEKAVNDNLKVEVTQERFDALVSWVYNVGIGWAAKSSVMRLVNDKAENTSIYSALMLFDKPPEILPRRKKEAILLTKGVYSEGGVANLFPIDARTHKPIYSEGQHINVAALLTKEAPEAPVVVKTPLINTLAGLWTTIKNALKRTP